MQAATIPMALREQLGETATLGLLEVLERDGREWRAE